MAKAPRRLTAATVLSLFGLGLMATQALEHFKVHSGTAGFESFCTVGAFDCIAVESSRYAEIFPGFPLAALAAAFYAALAVALVFARNPFWRRESLRAAAALSGTGVLVSLIYLVIMVSQLDTLCLFCIGQDVTLLAIFGLVLSLKPEGFKQHKPDRAKIKTLIASCGSAAVLVALLLKIMDPVTIPRREAQTAVDSFFSTEARPVAVSPANPTFGPADAPITIIKFSDFQCPACKLGAYSLHPVLQRYKDKIRFVFKNFPLDPSCNREMPRPLHEHACKAAYVGFCANKAGKFEQVYHALFDHQDEFDAKGPVALAVEAGLDQAELEKCIDSVEAKAAVNEDLEQGIELKVGATPTFFVNGRVVPGGYPTEIWIDIVERLLKQGK